MPPVNAAHLRSRRDELDLSNTELADRMQMSEKYLRNIINGIDPPSMRVIHRFSRALALPVEEILLGDRTPQGDPSEPPEQPKQPPKKTGRKESAGSGPKRAQPKSGAA